MAYGFGATLGAATTDSVTLAYATHGAPRSWSGWVRRNVTGNVFVKGATEALSFITGAWRFQRGFTTTSGVWTFTLGTSTATWIHLVLVYDSSSTANDPTLYVDGTAATTTEVTAPVGTATTTATAYRVGNNNAGTGVFDGEIAEFAIWNATLTANQITQLAKRFVPQFVPGMVAYCPLLRASHDLKNGATTVSGTAVTAHPPIIRRVGKSQPSIQVPYTGTGTEALSPLAMSATGAETFAGSASLALSPLAMAAAGAETFAATGSHALSPLALAATGLETFTGTGALALSPLAFAGTASETFTGTGSFALSPFATASTGAETFTGTGSLALAPFAYSSTGAESFIGVGTIALSPLAFAATGLAITPITGTGSHALQPFGFVLTGAVATVATIPFPLVLTRIEGDAVVLCFVESDTRVLTS